jgi:hypothetical protein
MRTSFVVFGRVAVMVAVLFLVASPSSAEEQEYERPTRDQEVQKPATVRPVGPIPRMPDGHPDLRGTWTKEGGNLNEANAPREEIPLLSPKLRQGTLGSIGEEPVGFTGGTDGRGTSGEGKAGPRMGIKPHHEPNPAPPTGIVDPADRILPWRPEAAQARIDHAIKMGPPPASFDHLELSARCAPPAPWYEPRGSIEILQRPEAVALLYEWDHTSRVIYTDGRPALGAEMRFFGGDAVGRWEGDTLVVTTTNLNGWGAWSRIFQKYSTAMRLTERFTMVSPELILYEITYDDPNLFTRPVKSVGYFYPSDDDEEVMEITCHEGSRTLYNIYGF